MAGPAGTPGLEDDATGETRPADAVLEGADTGSDPGDGFGEPLGARPRPWWARVLISLLIVALVLFLSPWVVRLFLPPINPDQKPPAGHYVWQCNTCHNVTPAVDVKTYPVYE